MHFDLLQSISLAGNTATPNDDRAGLTTRLAWVIDGATDLGPPGLLGAQGGAAWLASEAHAGFTDAEDAPLVDIHAAVGARLIAAWNAQRTREPEGRWEMPLAASVAVRLDADGLECGWLGDCTALLRRGGNVTRIGPVDDRAGETAQAAALAQHGLGSPKRSAPILAELRAGRGRPGMRVLSVDPAHMVVETARLACAPGDELLLMTDGFATLIDDYAIYEPATLMAAVAERGLAALAMELRGIEQEDAACTRFPRFKISDDATALWLRIGG
jgi:serine/threonine protein phosphatase PrpC